MNSADFIRVITTLAPAESLALVAALDKAGEAVPLGSAEETVESFCCAVRAALEPPDECGP